jgi:hypothetical protein
MLEHYRREFVDFNIASSREYYLFFSGKKPRYGISEIYSRYSDLFTLEAIERLKKQRDEIDEYYETNRTALSRLINFASEHYLELKVKELNEEIANAEADSKIEWGSDKIQYQDLPLILGNEKNQKTRRDLYNRQIRLIDSINYLRIERIEKYQTLSAKLGFDNYLELNKEQKKVDFVALDSQMQQFLANTDKIYRINLEHELSKHLHLPLSEAERYDSFYFVRLHQYNQLFPPKLFLSAYRETMDDLGINVEQQKNIKIDLSRNHRKSARAFCAPIVIPDDIRLVIKPVGGISDYEAFFHEAGHCQHFAFTAQDLRPEFKYSGDYALTETFAFLFNYLVGDQYWLEQMLNRTDLNELYSALMLTKLYSIRRHAGKLHYEIKLFSSKTSDKLADEYEESLSNSTYFHYNKVEYLTDIDGGLYTANYLRAWIFEVLLRNYLMTRYGRKWWKSKRAGNLLKEIWNTGNRYTVEEISSQIGLGPLIVEPLEAEFLMTLKS